MPRNPATGVRLPRAEKGEPAFLTHTQVEQLARGCPGYELFVRVLAYTGLRWGEATGVPGLTPHDLRHTAASLAVQPAPTSRRSSGCSGTRPRP